MVKASLLWDFWNLESDVFVSPIEKEVKKFESLSEASKDDDILKWWKFYSEGLPILSSVARAILAIPASTCSAKSERVFSTSGNTVTTKRTNLDPDKVEDLVTIACNLELLQEFESKNIVY